MAQLLIISVFVLAVIATSGIDYNIKLWEPFADELCTLHDLDEVCVCVYEYVHGRFTLMNKQIAKYSCEYHMAIT